MSNKKDDRQFITLGEKKIYFDELSPQGKGHFLNLQRVEARRNETSFIVSDLNASMNYYALMIQKDLETSTQQSSEEVPPSTDTK
tara:strand:+ start:1416 stop:1670 length:255 start_codon:yes stop_codon:yes gene_type:complete